MPKIIKLSKKTEKIKSPVLIYLISSLKGITLTLLLFSLTCLTLLSNDSFTIATKVFIYGSIAIGVLVSGYLAQRKLKGKGYVNGFVSSVIFYSLFVIFTTFVLRFNINANVLFVVPLVLISGIIGGIISANK